MIKIENAETMGWEHVIRGMRNPMNSWKKSDSGYCADFQCGRFLDEDVERPMCPINDPETCGLISDYMIGLDDLNLMKRLRNARTDHRKFMRMIAVYVDITAPLYWWKEFDTYKVGTVANSCSTMHKIHAKEFTLEDFSCEHLSEPSLKNLRSVIKCMNDYREEFLKDKDKHNWWQMIQLLPSSYNQRRTVMLNYEVLANIYRSRINHKLDEWRDFCEWIKTLPYSEIIIGEK